MSDIPIFNPSINPTFGPGSQPQDIDGANLDILQLPFGMETYRMPILPEPEVLAELKPAMAVLEQLQRQLQDYPNDRSQPLDLSELDNANLNLINQVLGEGEVSIRIQDEHDIRIQESVLAGVWRVQQRDSAGQLQTDLIEVAPIPARVVEQSASVSRQVLMLPESIPAGVLNAPPLFSEINTAIAQCGPDTLPHVINLTLLPQTDADLTLLQQTLGAGTVTILSRGYGNCRITSTGTRLVWWVQYFNSQDRNILNSLEISPVPEVACAAAEDIADSAERLLEILDVYR